MPYVICATWKAKAGEADAIIGLLDQVRRASLDEPGCLLFNVHRSLEDSSVFFLYEHYTSEDAFDAHAASDHVRAYVLEDAVHRLVSRKRERYEMFG